MVDESDKSVPPITSMERLLQKAGDLAEKGRIDELKKAIMQAVGQDQLTGILNRIGFLERLRDHMQSLVHTSSGPHPTRRRREEARRNIQHPLCIVFLDLDKFKDVNSTVGYEGGDNVLRSVAKYLFSSFRKESDAVARIYGDEFAIALWGAPEEIVHERLAHVQMLLRDHAWEFTDAQGNCNSRFLEKPVTFTANTVMLEGEEDFEKVLQEFVKVGDSVLEKKKERG